MYHKLRVRFAGKSNWENVAIDEMHIEVVRRSSIPNTCFVCDTDGVLCFEVAMDYDELVARLNGEEVPEKPQPVAVRQWVWVDRCGCFSICKDECEAKSYTARIGGHAVELKGEYTP